MNIFLKLFKKNKNILKDYAKEISNLNKCEYFEIPDNYGKYQLMSLYLDEYRKGQKAGYTPIITVTSPILLEKIKSNLEKYDKFESYQNEIINQTFDNGKDILNNLFKEYMSEPDEEYDIYGEYSGKTNPYNYFLYADKSYLCNDEKLVIFKIPVKEPWKVFAWMPFGGWNECPEPIKMIALCKYWYKKYGAVPSMITNDTLEMYVFQPLDNKKTAFEAAKEHYVFCNDIVEQCAGCIKKLAETLINSTIWYFL